MKMFLITLSLALLCATMPVTALPDLGSQSFPVAQYAEREAQSVDLEQFEGGYHALVFGFFLLVAIVVVFDACFGHHGHGHGHVHVRP